MTNEEEKIKGESLGKTFRKDFLYGLIVVLPIVATAWLVLIVIELISGPISLIFGQSIPASLSFILSIIIITLVGLLARNII
ncbi:MAG: putative membrane protein, partial [Candidatus Marinamargulisbacteria bacterium]